MLLLTLLFSFAQASDNHIGEYKTSHVWYRTPDIVICNDSPVKKEQIEKAKINWEKAGKKLGKVIITKDSCESKYKKGFILIMGDRDDLDANKSHAVTIRWYEGGTNRKTIESAFVEIDFEITKQSNQNIEIILTHELGHALGYGHVNKKNDIMNSDIMK